MATKKKRNPKRKAPARKPARKRPAARPRAAAAPAPAPAAQSQAPKRNGLWLALLIVAVLAAVIYRSRHQAEVPVAPPAAAPAPAATAPPGRSVAPAAAPTAVAPVPKPTAHRETAGEVGEPSLEFDRAASKTLAVRCWRSAAAPAQLEVFGPRNQRIRRLQSEPGKAGWQTLRWDGKDEQGRAVPAGLYFLRPSSQGLQQVRDVWVKG